MTSVAVQGRAALALSERLVKLLVLAVACAIVSCFQRLHSQLGSAGYYCVAGSSSPTQNICPAGSRPASAFRLSHFVCEQGAMAALAPACLPAAAAAPRVTGARRARQRQRKTRVRWVSGALVDKAAQAAAVSVPLGTTEACCLNYQPRVLAPAQVRSLNGYLISFFRRSWVPLPGWQYLTDAVSLSKRKMGCSWTISSLVLRRVPRRPLRFWTANFSVVHWALPRCVKLAARVAHCVCVAAGWYCPIGSINGAAAACPAGRWSASGATNSSCSGQCAGNRFRLWFHTLRM